MWSSTVTLCLLTLSVPPCLPGFVEHAEPESAWRRIAMVLEKRAEPDDLATAAMIRHLELRDPPGAQRLAAQASALRPDRPELTWLAFSLCWQSPGCDAYAAYERSRKLDPSNGTPILYLFELARSRGYVIEEPAQLAMLANAERIDIFWQPLLVMTIDALARRDVDGLQLRAIDESVVNSQFLVAAASLPPLQDVLIKCAGKRLEDEKFIELCAQVARTMLEADSVYMYGAGVELGRRVWREGSPERRALEEQHRQFEYQLSEATRLHEIANPQPGAASRFVERIRGQRSERAALLDLLRLHDVPLERPDGWKPERVDER